MNYRDREAELGDYFKSLAERDTDEEDSMREPSIDLGTPVEEDLKKESPKRPKSTPTRETKRRPKDESSKSQEEIIITLSDDEEADQSPPHRQSSQSIPTTKSVMNQSANDSRLVDLTEDDEVLETSLDDFDYNLKIMISGEYRQFSTTYRSRLNQTLKPILDDLRSKQKSLIVMSKEETQVSLTESPYSLNLGPGSVLNAWEIPNKASSPTQVVDPDALRIKLQDGHRKHLREYSINKHDKMILLKQQYAKEFDLDIGTMKLLFDGDVVDDDSTPEELDIDDGCIVDVAISKKLD